jgi:hypothetical protein
MKTRAFLIYTSMGLLFLLSGSQLRADITVRISVKFVHKPDGIGPGAFYYGTAAGFETEITRGNQILAATGRGYRLQVMEYLDVQPPVPGGEPPDFWFNLKARDEGNRRFIEGAAIADQTTWRWSANSINIYVNNSESGYCSFVGDGGAITLGNWFSTGSVLHEVGHFFNLRHTHDGDPDCNTFIPTAPLNSYLGDADGLVATTPDHACFDQDQLGIATFDGSFVTLSAAQQARVNTSYFNVMSYHEKGQLLDDQMDIWTFWANSLRSGFCSGRTWCVDRNAGGCIVHDGNTLCMLGSGPFTVVRDGVNSAQAGDIVLIRAGNYNEAMTINKPVTLRASRGNVSIGIP